MNISELCDKILNLKKLGCQVVSLNLNERDLNDLIEQHKNLGYSYVDNSYNNINAFMGVKIKETFGESFIVVNNFKEKI